MLVDMLIEIGLKLLAAILVVCIHEYPKIAAYKMLLHPVHKERSKISSNPLRYMDPFGLICFVLLGVGWQKPLGINANYLRDKNRGMVAIGLIGILFNLLVAVALIPFIPKLLLLSPYLYNFIGYVLYFSVGIVVVNLLPVPPLDMTKIIQALRPHNYFRFIQYEKMIQALFIVALAMGFVGNVAGSFYNMFVGSLIKMFLM